MNYVYCIKDFETFTNGTTINGVEIQWVPTWNQEKPMDTLPDRLREQADLIEGESPGGETDASVAMREAAEELERLHSRIGLLECQLVTIRRIGRQFRDYRDKVIDMRSAACVLEIDESKYIKD